VWQYERDHHFSLADIQKCPVTVQVAVRAWNPKLQIGGEYRAFVVNRELTAVSQYFEMIYFALLQTEKARKGSELKASLLSQI
jgi:hypothetical protein